MGRVYDLVRMEIDLPGYEKAWVDICDDILIEDLEELDKVKDFDRVRELLAEYVKDWNLKDRRGRSLPKPFKKPEVFRKLPLKLVLWLAQAVTRAALRSVPLLMLEAVPSATESGKPSSAETSDGLQES